MTSNNINAHGLSALVSTLYVIKVMHIVNLLTCIEMRVHVVILILNRRMLVGRYVL